MSSEYSSLKVRNDKITTLYSLPISKKYKKDLKKSNEVYKLSIVNDSMFKALFGNPARIKFPARLISYLLDVPFETLLENMKVAASDVPKEKEKSANQRSDLVCELEDKVIIIEMNNNDRIETMHRNIDYMFKQYNRDVQTSKDYNKYRQSILINLNNFTFKGIDEIYTISYIKDENGIVLTDRLIIINFLIPNLLKKCYNQGIKSLTELEQFLYAVIEDEEERVLECAKEMPDMENYIDEAKEVSNDDDLKFCYDQDEAIREVGYQDGFDDGYDDGISKGIEQGIKEGIEQGIKEGTEKTINSMIKSMYTNKIDLKIIAKTTGLSVLRVKQILGLE